MHSHPTRSVRRAITLGGLSVALGAPAWRCYADEPASSAAPTPAASSASAVPGPRPAFHLIYIDDPFRPPGLATQERDETLVDYLYYDLVQQIRARAPIVFEANGLNGDTTIVEPPTSDHPLVIDFPTAEPVITLAPVRYTKRKQGLFKTWAHITFEVVSRPGAQAPSATTVKHQITLTLGPDPVLGVLRIHRVDAEMVTGLLATTLDIAVEKGVLTLPQPKAVRPKA